MMGYGYGNGWMANWGGSGFLGFLWFLTWLIVFIDLVLLGVWLFKHVNKK